ncbi:thiaminase II [Apilactobacillus quenuiae]|uniref:thiaminase II n=1 Tax=Apilactobacillus quenuiae TaxID=2008377 RepID=UPI000D01EAED|nr:thiaminase II [Apilactobacillus quenuiae]
MFSDELKQSANPILQSIFKHQFIEGIKNGKVDDSILKFYVEQDYQYLSEFMKIYASIIPLLKDRNDIRFFNNNIDFILNDEIHHHKIFCKVANLKYEDLKNATPSPKAYLYQLHMYKAVNSGQILNILAALLPCPWTYNEIAKKIMQSNINLDKNPFKDWINFYLEEDQDNSLTNRLFIMLVKFANNLNNEKLDEAKSYFLKSCELEWQFWQQAFYKEDWQFKNVFSKELVNG